MYDGQLKELKIRYETMTFQYLTDLVQVYCGLVDPGALLYLPPNGESKFDLEVTISDDDIAQVWKKQGTLMMINMNAMPNQQECLKDPFLIHLRNKVVRNLIKECETRARI